MSRLLAGFLSLLLLVVAAPAGADIPPPYELFGIGANVAEAEPFPKMTEVLPKGPAAVAGVREGDAVIAIDGFYSKTQMPFYMFARSVKGKKNSVVELVLLRDGSNVVVIRVKRTQKLR